MKKQNHLILVVLLLGLLFSATLGIKFNFFEGLSIHGFWIYLPFQLFDLALKSSNDLFLTSHLIGYVFYLIFGIVMIRRIDFTQSTNKVLFYLFFVLIAIVFVSDFYSYYQELMNVFTGRHLRIGFLVFLVGLLILQKQLRTKSDITLE